MLGHHEEHPASGEPIAPPGRMPCVTRLRKALSLVAARHNAWATATSAPSICSSLIVSEGEGGGRQDPRAFRRPRRSGPRPDARAAGAPGR
jgi:hypothetical protein